MRTPTLAARPTTSVHRKSARLSGSAIGGRVRMKEVAAVTNAEATHRPSEPRSRLRVAAFHLAREQRRDCGCLDRRRLMEALSVEGAQKGLGQAECCEGDRWHED